MNDGQHRRREVSRTRVVVREDHVAASAVEHLKVIRETMEQSSAFTAISGKGLVAIGVTALVASVIAARHSRHFDHWMLAWIKEAALAVVIAAISFAEKARRTGVVRYSGPAKRMLVALLPPLVAGGVVTAALYAHSMADPAIVPGLWLLLYGVGVMAGGAHSIRVVPAMGLCFCGLGVLALASTPSLMNAYMAAGFGGLHLIFGGIIAWKHGG